MSRPWTTLAVGLLAFLAGGLLSAPPTLGADLKKEAPSFEVPYRLTVPKHVMVRAKINGKGPFNFILDTGAPALFIAESVGKKLGLESDDKKWGTLKRFEIEGGVVLEKVRARIETPFQLEGMNGMGLAGAEVHGLIGYDVLARYRLTLDFTNDKLVWTPLAYKPVAPAGMGGKGGGQGGLEIMGGLMKGLGSLLGRKATPDTTLRGFLGVTLLDGAEFPKISAVLPGGPAGKAGLKVGDRILKVGDRTVTSAEDVSQFLGKVPAGNPVKLSIERGKEKLDVSLEPGEGI
jgi:hypothetical protein